jgi:hypothetical protein
VQEGLRAEVRKVQAKGEKAEDVGMNEEVTILPMNTRQLVHFIHWSNHFLIVSWLASFVQLAAFCVEMMYCAIIECSIRAGNGSWPLYSVQKEGFTSMKSASRSLLSFDLPICSARLERLICMASASPR